MNVEGIEVKGLSTKAPGPRASAIQSGDICEYGSSIE